MIAGIVLAILATSILVGALPSGPEMIVCLIIVIALFGHPIFTWMSRHDSKRRSVS